MSLELILSPEFKTQTLIKFLTDSDNINKI